MKSRLLLFAVCTSVLLFSTPRAQSESRTWTDRSGKFELVAELVEFKNGAVTLRREDGKTLSLPLSKLSAADNSYLKKLNSNNGKDSKNEDLKSSQQASASDRREIKQVANSFLTHVIAQDGNELRTLLVEEASDDSTANILEKLAVPDRGSPKYVKKIVVDGHGGTAHVNFKSRGRFHEHQLVLKQEKGLWRISGLVGNVDKDDTFKIDVAQATSGSPARDIADADEEEEDEKAAESDDLFKVPDGDAKELVEFIATLQQTRPPKGLSRKELLEYQAKLLDAVIETTDRILDIKATDQQLGIAAQNKLMAVRALSSIDPQRAEKLLAGLPDQFEDVGLQDFVASARSLELSLNVAKARPGKGLEETIADIKDHLKELPGFGQMEIQLASIAAQTSRQLSPEITAGVHREMGELLASFPNSKAMGESLLGAARRYALVGNEMPLQGVMLDGTPFDLADYKGKVVLVDFWATWCGPCIREMPNIRKNYEQYKDQGFEVVAVSVDRDLKALAGYVEKEQPPWTILADYHSSNTAKASAYYGISAIPTTILIGQDGNVISLSCRGAQLGEQLAKLLGSDET